MEVSLLDIPPTFEADLLSAPTIWMPFGKRLLLYVSFTLAVEEGREHTCVIFLFYFMYLLAATTWGDCSILTITVFIKSYS